MTNILNDSDLLKQFIYILRQIFENIIWGEMAIFRQQFAWHTKTLLHSARVSQLLRPTPK